MEVQLDRVDRRKALKPQREPYWQRVSQGRSLGFRRIAADSAGNWIARVYVGGSEKYKYEPLGDFANLLEKERFDAAKRAAEAWFRHIDMGGSTEGGTVKQACEAYVSKLRQEKGEESADDTEGRFRRLVYDDPIARVELSKLAPRHVAEWKKRALATGNSRGYFNRNATALRAALNLAKSRLEVASDHAWAQELKPLEGADARRTLYLDRKARRKLIDSASDELRPLVKALALLPLRPGELVGVRVDDFDARHGTLRVSGKTGSRTIPLPPEAVRHFKACAQDKLPTAWLVSRANGNQWDRFTWRDLVKLAAAGARLPAATCLYTLRHSTITDLVTSGLDLFTVAKISGTSVAMIEKHYGHLQREHAREALKALAL
jgi:integrase